MGDGLPVYGFGGGGFRRRDRGTRSCRVSAESGCCLRLIVFLFRGFGADSLRTLMLDDIVRDGCCECEGDCGGDIDCFFHDLVFS